ncbi:MAG: type II toxin-antitoxin system VapC family toxin [Cyanobacteria bacterium P01_F01_bin.33]
MYLADTNILLRSIHTGHPNQPVAVGAINTLLQHHRVCYTMQNIAEFWTVCTRPMAKNGFGMTAQQVRREIDQIEETLFLLPDDPAVYPTWKDLVTRYEVKGVKVHDAKLVATMLVHGVTSLLTFDVGDFKRYSEIEIVNPASTQKK